MSASGVVTGLMPKVSTRALRMLGLTKAGSVGPRRTFFTPRYSRARRMATAFCSYQERTRLRGRSLTVHLSVSESLRARATAE